MASILPKTSWSAKSSAEEKCLTWYDFPILRIILVYVNISHFCAENLQPICGFMKRAGQQKLRRSGLLQIFLQGFCKVSVAFLCNILRHSDRPYCVHFLFPQPARQKIVQSLQWIPCWVVKPWRTRPRERVLRIAKPKGVLPLCPRSLRTEHWCFVLTGALHSFALLASLSLMYNFQWNRTGDQCVIFIYYWRHELTTSDCRFDSDVR